MKYISIVFIVVFASLIGYTQDFPNEAVICDDGICVRYPSDVRISFDNNQAFFCFGDNSKGQCCLIILKTQNKLTDLEYKESRIKQMSKSPDFEIFEETDINIDDKKGISFMYNNVIDNGDTIWQRENIVEYQGKIYSFIYNSNNYNLFSLYNPIQEKIIQSVMFLEYGLGDCSIAKQGKFNYENGTKGNYIEINGSNHVEYHINSDRMIYNKIEWKSDCEYNIIYDHTNKPKGWPFKKGDIINIKILTANPTSYSYVWRTGNQSGINKLVLIEN
jgi:hypothetical protein